MISLQDVSVFRGAREVLKNISISFAAEEFVSIVGANGAGKSTLLRVATGLLGASRGEVCVEGKPLKAMSVADRAKAMAWLPQTRPSAWNLTVEDLAALGRFSTTRLPYARCATGDRDAIDIALQRTGAAHLKGRSIESLSGGEEARVHLARVLASPAPTLLLDEPCAGLDIATQLDVLRVLADEAASGRLVIVALHELRWALQFTQRTVVINNGQLVKDDAPKSALSAECLQTCFRLSRSDAKAFVINGDD